MIEIDPKNDRNSLKIWAQWLKQRLMSKFWKVEGWQCLPIQSRRSKYARRRRKNRRFSAVGTTLVNFTLIQPPFYTDVKHSFMNFSMEKRECIPSMTKWPDKNTTPSALAITNKLNFIHFPRKRMSLRWFSAKLWTFVRLPWALFTSNTEISQLKKL